MKQILFVASEFPPNSGGVGVYVRNLARWLSLRGWDCWVATWVERSNLDSEHRVIRIPFRRVQEFGDILFSKELDERLVQLGLHDAIENVHSPYPQSRVKPDVSTFHAVMRHVIPRAEFTAGKRAVHMFALPFVSGNERRLMRAPVVLAVSESVVDQLRKSHGFQGHASIVGNGVDPTVFRPGPKSPTPVVLYVGRLDLNKGVMDLVQIARLVLRALPDVKFRIVGVGEARRM